jgi:hypothetical protein
VWNSCVVHQLLLTCWFGSASGLFNRLLYNLFNRLLYNWDWDEMM